MYEKNRRESEFMYRIRKNTGTTFMIHSVPYSDPNVDLEQKMRQECRTRSSIWGIVDVYRGSSYSDFFHSWLDTLPKDVRRKYRSVDVDFPGGDDNEQR